jgi:hypothetical protein
VTLPKLALPAAASYVSVNAPCAIRTSSPEAGEPFGDQLPGALHTPFPPTHVRVPADALDGNTSGRVAEAAAISACAVGPRCRLGCRHLAK